MTNKVFIATYQDRAKPLTDALPSYKLPVVVRLGGHKQYPEYPIQINSAAAIMNSINKLKQKTLLINGGCKTLPLLGAPQYPCVLKGVVRSCGTHVSIVNNDNEFLSLAKKMQACSGHIIEPLFNATSEYRLHCTRDEVFFSVKKVRKEGHENDVIINSKNHINKREFLKPRLWKEVQSECLKAMKVLDLDIACFDVMYSSTNNEKHEFFIAEANTNPELLKNTFDAYATALDKIIKAKIKQFPSQEQQVVVNEAKNLSKKELASVIVKLMDGNFIHNGDSITINL